MILENVPSFRSLVKGSISSSLPLHGEHDISKEQQSAPAKKPLQPRLQHQKTVKQKVKINVKSLAEILTVA
jgi:hypothetical protein